MSVTAREVQHIAALARLHLEPARVPHLVEELNGILEHVEALGSADTSMAHAADSAALGMPLRADGGEQRPLAYDRESFAPNTREGFFLVPRLSTHEDAGDE